MCVFVVMKQHVMWLTEFLIIFGQQWSSMAQRNKEYQALDTQTILVSRISSLLVLAFSRDSSTTGKTLNYL